MSAGGGVGEARLRTLLREAPVPGGEGAERRGLGMVAAAFAERRPERHNPLPRLALALAVAALLGALLLSPAGASVRDWVGDVFGDRVPRPEHGLAEIPGGGRLLVAAADGPWVVGPDGSRSVAGLTLSLGSVDDTVGYRYRESILPVDGPVYVLGVVGPDGSRRLLGEYGSATWSPRGLYVAVAAGRTLSAVEPDGTPHWSLSAAGPISDPRWSPSGFRIAYRSGRQLRVTAADG
ncbi:MAG: GIDE domain-containing protein, partial [Solirubrobacterales bacterium]